MVDGLRRKWLTLGPGVTFLVAVVRLLDAVERVCAGLGHSPILLALPDARILEIGDDGSLDLVSYDDALPVRTTRLFLADPAAVLRTLLD